MIHTNIERWCKHLLEDSENLNDAYRDGLEDWIDVSQDLQSHGSGCHNNDLWDCACEGPSTMDFTYGVLDYLSGVADKTRQSVLTQILVDYMAYMERQEEELYDIQQDTQRRLERLQNKMRAIYEESERQGYAEIVDLITLDTEEE